MKLLAIDDTAKDFYLCAPQLTRGAKRTRACSAPDRPPATADAEALCERFSHPPYHVLTSQAQGSRTARAIRCHRHRGPLPSGSFLRISSDLLVASPEYLFLRAAKTLPLVHLIAFGYSLCGTYYLNDAGQGAALSSAAKISRYLARCEGMHGIKKARQALRHVLDNAASVREAATAMKLTLPCRMGGYGLPHPVLNQRIDLPSPARVNLGKSHVRIDLCWSACGVGVEYDSDAWHTGGTQITRDSRRRNELACLNFDIITVTNDEMKSVADMDRIAKALANKLRIRKRPAVKGYDRLKVDLRDILEGWA